MAFCSEERETCTASPRRLSGGVARDVPGSCVTCCLCFVPVGCCRSDQFVNIKVNYRGQVSERYSF